MATSFSAAALGAEGLAADVTMLVGNGYVPGHAAYAMELLRSTAGVRKLFEGRLRGARVTRTLLRNGACTTAGPAPAPPPWRWRTAASSSSATTTGPRPTTAPTRSSTWPARSSRPAFVDSHVHTVRTGFALTGLDLTGSPSLADALDELAAYARQAPGAGRARRPGLGRDRLARAPAAHRRRAGAGRPGRGVPTSPASTATPPSSRPALAALVPGLRRPRRLDRRRAGRARRPPRRPRRPRGPDRPRRPPRRRPGRLPGDGRAGHRRLPRERRTPHRPRARDRADPVGRRRGRPAGPRSTGAS